MPDGGLISDGLGHSLHNNEKCEEQIIKQTEDAFNKEAQPPLESKPLPQSTSPYQVKAKDANGG